MGTVAGVMEPDFEFSLSRLGEELDAAFSEAGSEHELRQCRARFVGPRGEITKRLKTLAALPAESRPAAGKALNALKLKAADAYATRLKRLESRRLADLVAVPQVDGTLPGRRPPGGSLHPLRQATAELVAILRRLGFKVADGPEVEYSVYNFDKLGFPEDHPARDMQDSFFVKTETGDLHQQALLRTHTSTVQVREMLTRRPPLALISPGAVFRRDDDPTHSPMFFQIEALCVDKDITFADLRGVLQHLLDAFFGERLRLRFRPSYFPFVEPGGEVDIWRDGRWMEILGCGMVHPVVFEHVGYDPSRVQGFAFGLGVDRMAMLKHGIADIRWLYGNDPRFLLPFGIGR